MHDGSVALVLNLRTLHVPHQYYVIFDDVYNYVPIKHKYQKATLDILKEVGIFVPNINPNNRNFVNDISSKYYDGIFTHPYFNPK